MFKKKSKSKKSSPSSDSQTPTLSKKELAALKKKKSRERQEFIQFTSSLSGAALVVSLALLPVGGPKAAIGAFGAILSLALSYKYYRQALWFFLLYMPFSGTITYWIGGGAAPFQVAKDAFFIPAFIALWQTCKKQKKPILIPQQLLPALSIVGILCLLTLVFVNGGQQFSGNPKGQPILMGILGIKILLGYAPLIPCAYYLIRNKKEFIFFTRSHIVIILICCTLGLLQYWRLQTGQCVGTREMEGVLLYKADINAKCLVGGSLAFSPQVGFIRLPGTFVSPWHWAWFLISGAFFSFASAFNDPALIWQLSSIVALILVFINSVICGQRAAMLVVPAMLIILIFVTGQFRNLKRFVPLLIALAVLAFGSMFVFPDMVNERVQSLIDRWNASPPTEFIAHQAEFTSKGHDGILGNGLGRGTNSARPLGKTTLIETYYAKLMYELGPLGVGSFLFFASTLSWICFKNYRSVRDLHLRGYAASFWVFVAFIGYNPYWYPLDTDPVAVYYWFLAGVILKLPEIDRQERLKLQEAEEPPVKRKGKALQKVA
jgi:hypothetical protein